MLDELKTGRKTVGLKQTQKAVRDRYVKKVFIARDADERVIRPILEECGNLGIPVETAETMQELGAACGIDVGAAMAAILE